MPSLRSARYIRCFAKYIRKTTNSICFCFAQTRYDINPRSHSEHIELLMVHSCHQQYIERVSVYRKSAFADLYRCVPALWQVRRGSGFFDDSVYFRLLILAHMLISLRVLISVSRRQSSSASSLSRTELTFSLPI